jgi:hypothetical protein
MSSSPSHLLMATLKWTTSSKCIQECHKLVSGHTHLSMVTHSSSLKCSLIMPYHKEHQHFLLLVEEKTNLWSPPPKHPITRSLLLRDKRLAVATMTAWATERTKTRRTPTWRFSTRALPHHQLLLLLSKSRWREQRPNSIIKIHQLPVCCTTLPLRVRHRTILLIPIAIS